MSDLSKTKKTIKQLSNSFSTGGGGYNYERHVQAVFLLSLLVDGFSPVLDCPIMQLEFQAKHLEYHTDDLVVVASQQHRSSKLLCSIKNAITATAKNKVFQEVITAAWNDYCGNHFDPAVDRIALITGNIAKSSMTELREIHERAVAASNSDDFICDIKQSRFTSKRTVARFDTLRDCLKLAKGEELSNEDLWGFCKAFLLVVFDGNYEGSIHEALCKSLIQFKSSEDPRLVWGLLTDFAGQCSQNARSITKKELPDFIQEQFGIPSKGLPTGSFKPAEKWARIALLGAWDENNEADRDAIERITGTSFSEFLVFAREQLHIPNSRLFLSNGIWHVSYRKELLAYLTDYFYDDIICNAFHVASELVTERSKHFSDSGLPSYFIPAGGLFSHSTAFRKGLLEGLCILAHEKKLPNCSDHLVEQQAVSLVRTLFAPESWELLAGLKDLTQIIAEMSPKTYLQELETFVVEHEQEFKNLIPQRRQSILDVDYLSDIRHSLITLAWVPDLLSGCIRCMGVIEMIGHNYTNLEGVTINDIANIMNVLHPQTFATLKHKENAILALQTDSPELCWTVLKELLPESSFVVFQTSKPKYVDVSEFEREIPQKERTETLKLYIRLAISLSFDLSERMAQLVSRVRIMDQRAAVSFLEQIQLAAVDWSDEMKYPIWSSLRSLKARIVLENDRKKPRTKLFKQIGRTIDATVPESDFYRNMYLYLEDNAEYLIDYSESRWKRREEERKDAIYKMFESDGVETVIRFGEKVNNTQDVGSKLGARLDLEQMKDLLKKYFENKNSLFYPYVIYEFIRANGSDILHKIGLETYDESFRATVLISAPFDPELFSIIDHFLSDISLYWNKVKIKWFPPTWSQKTINNVIQELSKVGRFNAIINALGHCVEKYNLEDNTFEAIMNGAMLDQSGESLDAHAVREIIKKLQSSPDPNIDNLWKIEYNFLPFLDEYSGTKPKALYFKLSNESTFFCTVMEYVYKPRHDDKKHSNLPEGVAKRLFSLTYNYCVVPGIEWDGSFNVASFRAWIDDVIRWARETDRMEVVQQTIGNGLSYAEKTEGLPNDTILDELNKPQNREMRHGYQLGIQNQRGVHWIDPEGKPERALAQEYKTYAQNAEERGYSRVFEMMNSIANSYLREAEENRKMLKRHDEELE